MAKNRSEELEEETLQPVNQQTSLNTHERINTVYSGEIMRLEKGYAKVRLETNEVMRADEVGLVHGGFIFSAADFAAMAAVNEPNVVLAACNCLFLAPVRVGDSVTFEATEHQKEGRKRNVTVRGFVHDIKVFEGEFKTVVTERHVLRLDLMKNVEG
ncbi:hotdog domain-containing protein [Sulfuricurvum sp.]|uniref:hotdog domain-containing protein n=1 Tax=Sulfuricurvum sp. TaxID=2025608 RepID=UPI0026291DC3|nr:hotdog domain-containing protein [Sulfuricurvum sp.]MDD2266229.1 hotdog domain-containing protein [Sulfuricurvum sp.]MDD2783163.1 hotdog domain-containing protein [Sulfuricurvum sp.]HZF71622.1 hotdog domain-containing protein [Sulfuricurvum sp.]